MYMTRTIWIGIVVVVLVAGGWWYLNSLSAPAISETTQFPATQTAQQDTSSNARPVVNNQTTQQLQSNPSPTRAQTQPIRGVATKEYVNAEYGISFFHPASWQCKTYRTNSEHTDWYQTICDDDGVWAGDPFVIISVPYVVEVEGVGADPSPFTGTRSETTMTGQNAVVITKTISRPAKSGLNIGSVDYVFNGSASMKSYRITALYGTGKPYATAEDAEWYLDHIAQSLIVN